VWVSGQQVVFISSGGNGTLGCDTLRQTAQEAAASLHDAQTSSKWESLGNSSKDDQIIMLIMRRILAILIQKRFRSSRLLAISNIRSQDFSRHGTQENILRVFRMECPKTSTQLPQLPPDESRYDEDCDHYPESNTRPFFHFTFLQSDCIPQGFGLASPGIEGELPHS
jgi:hypothetical protein